MADPTVTRSNLIGGPAKHVFDSATFWTVDDIELKYELSTSEVKSSMFGRIDETWHDMVVRTSLVPFGNWDTVPYGVLFPAFYTNPTIGASLMTTTDKPWKIWGANGDLYTIQAAGIIKPPSIVLGTDKDMFGSMDVAGVIKDGAKPSDSNAWMQIQTGQADPGGTFATTNFKRQAYTATWGAVSGFSGFQAEEGWTIECQPTLEPVKIQGLTRDYRLTSVAWMASCIPHGPTAANIDAATQWQGTGALMGERLGSNGADLTITGTGVQIVLKQAALKSAGFRFGSRTLRSGEVGFVSAMTFSAGAAQALVTVGTGA